MFTDGLTTGLGIGGVFLVWKLIFLVLRKV